MLASVRLAQIVGQFGPIVQRLLIREVDGEALSITLYFEDGTNLRVTEKWRGAVLERYSYYWLDAQNQLKIGWDNAPHHYTLAGFPHHKHVAGQTTPEPASERCLEDVMKVIHPDQ